MYFQINDTFNKELQADTELENTSRTVTDACFSYVTPRIPSNPSLVHASLETSELLGLSESDTKSDDFLHYFSGAKVLENTQPYAMCYGGHQFGHWAGQLGDGRAINLTEVIYQNKNWALQLKGAGATPYSRRADGLAVLRSSVREHLCSEAMFHLGVPTTRSLSLILTGDQVLRDMLYNGNAEYEKGAVVCRVAPSFIRFGNFEIFASRGDLKNLKALTDYTIRHFYPDFEAGTKDGYIHFFETVAQKTKEMILHWQRVGFVHGVMNTDNMSILGLTIDFGPYGWLEGYDYGWTPNTTDRAESRYRYGNQAHIALWNLLKLANALYPLIEDTKPLERVLTDFKFGYQEDYLAMMRQKLGLQTLESDDEMLISTLERNLHLTETDMTIFYRNLSLVKKSFNETEMLETVKNAFYEPSTLMDSIVEKWKEWFTKYALRLNAEPISDEARKNRMNSVNPKYVLRNYMAQLAIDDADKGDYKLIQELYTLLKKPYDEQPEFEKWFAKRPDWARDKVGCSMLSCSS